jgi:hypothetical protein
LSTIILFLLHIAMSNDKDENADYHGPWAGAAESVSGSSSEEEESVALSRSELRSSQGWKDSPAYPFAVMGGFTALVIGSTLLRKRSLPLNQRILESRVFAQSVVIAGLTAAAGFGIYDTHVKKSQQNTR